MKLRQVGLLLHKEFVHGSKSFFFIFAVVVPILVTLMVSTIFGTFIGGKPKLGICDRGNSRVTQIAMELDSLAVRKYPDQEKLKVEVETGALDMGIIIPAGFEEDIKKGETPPVTAYIYGESLANDRAVIATAVASVIREVVGGEAPFEITPVTIGEEENISWKNRMLPLVVLMAVFFGGFLIPSSSLVNEKQKGTIKALAVSPVTMGTVYFAKGLAGFLISLLMGVIILIMNGLFAGPVVLLVTVLGLGAVMAAEFGILLGSFVRNIDVLFTAIKSLNLFLYAPGIVYLFPAIPAWVGMIFPTYYIINPVIEITQKGAGWPEVYWKICILFVLDLLLFYAAALASKREGASG